MDTLLHGRRKLLLVAWSAASAGIGFLAWSGAVPMLALSFSFLLIVLQQQSRSAAYTVGCAYYAGSTWPIIPGAVMFFGVRPFWWQAVMLWLLACALLALPWSLFYFPTWLGRSWTVPLALAATCFPPLGLIGWASPLTGAGVLFPGTSWFGILALAFLPGWIICRPWLGGTLLAGLMIVSWANYYPGTSALSDSWEGVNTTLGRTQLEMPDPLLEFHNGEWVQERALRSKAKVIVFPEATVPRWNAATEAFWEPTFAALESSGKTILFGATASVAASRKLLNIVIIRGASTPAAFLQRVPVPISMWKPLSDDGMPLRLTAPGTIGVAGQRATVLVCYELLLTWPVLAASLEHPTVLVGVANDYWAKQTAIPACQQAALTSWARLFRLPSIMAMNL